MSHQRAPDRQHLLLAAAEKAGHLLATLLQAREVRVHEPQVVGVAGALRVRAGPQVLVDRQVLEDPPAFHHLKNAHPNDLSGVLAGDLTALLTAGTHPARNPAMNLADLAAQVAACRRGAERLLGLIADHGRETVAAYMGHLLDYADGAVRGLLEGLSDGRHRVAMDNGAQVAVAVTVDRANCSATIDFAGTSPQQRDKVRARVRERLRNDRRR